MRFIADGPLIPDAARDGGDPRAEGSSVCRAILTANRCPPRIRSGAGFRRIALRADDKMKQQQARNRALQTREDQCARRLPADPDFGPREDPGRISPAGVRGAPDVWGGGTPMTSGFVQARQRHGSRLSRIAHLPRPYTRFNLAAEGSAAAALRGKLQQNIV